MFVQRYAIIRTDSQLHFRAWMILDEKSYIYIAIKNSQKQTKIQLYETHYFHFRNRDVHLPVHSY